MAAPLWCAAGDTLSPVPVPDYRPGAYKPANTRRAPALELGDGDTVVYTRKRKEAGFLEYTGRREYKRPRRENSTELQALCRLLPTKRGHDSQEPDDDSPKKRRRNLSLIKFGNSYIECLKTSDTYCEDKADREIDIGYQRNPCPSSCPCRPSYNAPEVLEIPRRRRKRVSIPLYNKFLQHRLLKVNNTCLLDCCQFRCFRKWIQYERKYIRMIFRDYY